MRSSDIEDAKTWLMKKMRRAEKNYESAMEREDYKAAKNLLKELEVLDTLIRTIAER